MRKKPVKVRRNRKTIFDSIAEKEDSQTRLIDNIKRKPNVFILGTGISLFLILIAIGTFLSMKLSSNNVPDYMTSKVKDVPPISTQPEQTQGETSSQSELLSEAISNILTTFPPFFLFLMLLPFLIVIYNAFRRSL